MWLNRTIPISIHRPSPAAVARRILALSAVLIPQPAPTGAGAGGAGLSAEAGSGACSRAASSAARSGSGSFSSRSPQISAGIPSSSATRSSRPIRSPESGPIRASSRVGEGGTIGMRSRSDCVACA